VYLIGTGGGLVEYPDVAPEADYEPPKTQGNKGGMVTKLRMDGRPLWLRLFSGGSPATSTLDSVIFDAGRLILAGTVTGYVTFGGFPNVSSQGTPGQLKPDIVLLDMDAETGTVEKLKTLPSQGSEGSPRLARSGAGYLLAGTCEVVTTVPGLGPQSCKGLFLGRMDETLSFEDFDSYLFEQAAGLHLVARPDGGAFLGGRYQGKGTLDKELPDSVGNFQGFLALVDPDGVPENSLVLGKSGRTELTTMLPDEDGGVLLGGWTQGSLPSPGLPTASTPAGEQNAYVLKLGAALTSQVTWIYPGSGKGLLQGVTGLARGTEGALYVGATMKGAFLVGNESHESKGEGDLVLMRYAP
jgi:hypothetical protein